MNKKKAELYLELVEEINCISKELLDKEITEDVARELMKLAQRKYKDKLNEIKEDE